MNQPIIVQLAVDYLLHTISIIKLFIHFSRDLAWSCTGKTE